MVFISDQRVFALKRTAVPRIEMLKQVQHDGGFMDEELRTWTRSVGTKNRSLLGSGLLTDNVVFISDQRVFALKRTAVL